MHMSPPRSAVSRTLTGTQFETAMLALGVTLPVPAACPRALATLQKRLGRSAPAVPRGRAGAGDAGRS